MPVLTEDTPVQLAAGRYQYIATMTSGTVTFSISHDEGGSYQTMTDGVISASEDGTMLLSNVYVKANFTGDATAYIDYIGQ